MKKVTILLILVLTSLAARVCAQNNSTRYYDESSQQLDKTVSTDSKKNFWDLMVAAGSVLDNSGNGFTVNPTLDKLGIKNWGNNNQLAKRFQLNVTPVAKGTNFLKYDSLAVGFKVAIINNFSHAKWDEVINKDPNVLRFFYLNNLLIPASMSQHWFEQFNFEDKIRKFSKYEMATLKVFMARVDSGKVTVNDVKLIPFEMKYCLIIAMANPNNHGSIPNVIRNGPAYQKFIDPKTDTYAFANNNQVPKTITPADEKLLEDILVAEYNQVYAVIHQLDQNFLAKKPQLNASFNTIQNFVRNRLQGVYLEADYTQYFGRKNKFSYSIKSIFSLENDTLKRTYNFVRQVSKTTLAVDWLSPLWNPKNDKLSPLELKLACELDWVTNNQTYAKEKKFAPSPILNVTWNLTNKVAIPIAIKYDTKKANLFGFLTVQYAVGGKSKS